MTQAVFITGAGKRIGSAIARAFADKGFALALHYHHSQKEVEALAKTIPNKTCLLQADLETLDLNQARTLINTAETKLETEITCLINNASLFERDKADAINEKLMEEHLAINLQAPLFLSQALAKRKTNIQRNIIMLLDQKVLNPNPDFFSYTISKMALWDASRLLARAFAPHIRVNGIAPGPVLPSKHQTQAAFQKAIAQTPLKGSASPEDIANACLFLCQHESITEQVLALDGGQHFA